MRPGVLALVLSPLAGCALVAGLGDFEPADDTSGGGENAGGSPTSSTSTTTSAGGGGAGASGGASTTSSSTSTATSTTSTSSTGGGGGGTGGGSCFDGKKNGGETDLDCGGPDCPGCKIGQDCVDGTDCVTTKCGATKCVCNDHLVISEVRSRGLSGAADEFVEIYNPTSAPVTLDPLWKIESRNAGGSVYATRWTGSGETIPAYGHFLVAGSAYTQLPVEDASLTSGITDESSVRLKQDTVVVDAICYCGMGSGNCNAFTQVGYSCEMNPMVNPNASGADDDVGMERKAGGTQGNCVDTINSLNDFVAITPAKPQNLASLPTP